MKKVEMWFEFERLFILEYNKKTPAPQKWSRRVTFSYWIVVLLPTKHHHSFRRHQRNWEVLF